MNNFNVSSTYLQYRKQVLKYTNKDMNLQLDNDEQVYIAVFDVPTESGIIGMQVQTIALVFGLNTHIYLGNGEALTGLERNENIMKAMQSLLISSYQVLGRMELTNDIEFYESKNIRAYLKTEKGIYYKELIGDCKEDRFLMMLLNNVRKEISSSI